MDVGRAYLQHLVALQVWEQLQATRTEPETLAGYAGTKPDYLLRKLRGEVAMTFDDLVILSFALGESVIPTITDPDDLLPPERRIG